MFRSIVLILNALLSTGLASLVHNLDDERNVQQLSRDGLNLSGFVDEAHLKISSNNGSTGYSWIIDFDSCDGIVEITSGYVVFDNDDSLLGG